ncbi:VanW family protein [Metabacillus sp. HB246100]|uniref:VanW family protein n=1 Tax=Bacillus weihaiensis TaxID=1547283 RepID=UPI0023525A3A|nr:VanW family protein [Bacillus weihaiensis]
MHKKYVSSILCVFMLVGCESLYGSSGQEEKLEVKEIQPRNIQVASKNVEYSIDLIHPLSKEILLTYTPSEGAHNEAELEKLARSLGKQLDQPMVPVKRNSNGKLTNGQSRIILHEAELVTLLEMPKALERTIELPMDITEPNVTEAVSSIVDQQVIGAYKTSFNPGVKGRTENIALSANEINQIILGPGDRFYFNLVVGERTPERGYQKAMEIVDKEFVEGIGGGICQTSSTLYNAVANAGLEIIEVHSHSRSIGYVPAGKDATVSWNGPDFKFMNNKDYPVMLKTIVDRSAGTIEVQVTAPKKAV